MTDSASELLNQPVRTVVSQLFSELDQLVREKALLLRQARNLRKTLRKHSTDKKSFSAERRKRISRPRQNPPYLKLQSSYDQLERACRIAFMEAGGEATPERLYLLILRRGSFVFPDVAQDPIDLIVGVLNSMSAAGTVVCSTGKANGSWELKPGEGRRQAEDA